MPAEFFVQNLGCKVNRVESDEISAALLAAGAKRVAREVADVIIINTCTVTAEADAKTRKAIRQALALEKQPLVIATGCAIAIDQDWYQSMGERVIAEPNRIAALDSAKRALCVTEGFERMPRVAEGIDEGARVGEGFATRLGIKIQDGCDNRCTFCIVCIARGPARSAPLEAVIAQTVKAEELGVREVVLTGVNIGEYQEGTAVLETLLQRLLDATAQLRIRLSSLEPQHATNTLLGLMAASEGRICAHLHLPLQSGSDAVLRSMGRLYDAAFFAERVGQAKGLMPHLALTTDIIAGFPGESDNDFEEGLEFCARMGFSRMHVFPFSARPGTPAAQMPGEIAPRVRTRRAAILRELSNTLQAVDLVSRIGTVEKVLVERAGRGTSESYHAVEVPPGEKVGGLVRLLFTGSRGTLVTATPVKGVKP